MTNIKIKLSRPEYEALRIFLLYAAMHLEVVDAVSLYEKEVLEIMNRKFETKTFKIQKYYTFSFSIAETIVFMKRVGQPIMIRFDSYEKAVYDSIYNNHIVPQIQRAIQMRMNFNSN